MMGTLYALSAQLHLKALMRLPAYWVPTLLFPAMLYIMFGSGTEPPRADYQMASFVIYGMVGVAFFQFGVSIAQDRESRWERYRRTLPGSLGPRIAAQLFSAIIFSLATGILVIAVSFVLSSPSIDLVTVLTLLAATLVISLPFTLLGIALGYWSSAKSAVAIANLLYLPLAFLGGLWMPPNRLPETIAELSWYTPTRHAAEIVWSIVGSTPFPTQSAIWLLAFTVLFGAFAIWGYRRDEGFRYG